MRAIFAVAISLYAVCAQAQKASYDAMQGDKNVGSLTIERKVAGSTLTVTIVMNIHQPNGPAANIMMSTVYDSKGLPKTKKAEIHAGSDLGKVTAVFSGLTAKVTAISKGKTHTREVKAPGKSPITDPGVWWFVSGVPKEKASYTYQSLNPVTLQWVESKTQYVGTSNINIRGKQVKAHQVVSVRGGKEKSTVWLDDKGIAWMLDQGHLKFVRR